jgi:hypothetical protein
MKFRLIIAFLFVMCFGLGAQVALADTIVNLDASVVANYPSATAVNIVLGPGTYLIHQIGKDEGGLWDGWSAFTATSSVAGVGDCPAFSTPAGCGFQSSYEFMIPSMTSFATNYWNGATYDTALQALSHRVDATFTLTTTDTVRFSLNDGIHNLADNRGGMSLRISAVPEPSILLLLSVGMIGVAGIWKMRRGPVHD